MDEKDKTRIPEKYDTEDKIFNMCDASSLEFTRYLTKFDDIGGHYQKRFISEDYKDLNLDHVRMRKNGTLTHLEHHAVLTHFIMRRNFHYLTSLHQAANKLIFSFIYNTGKILKNPTVYASPTSIYDPVIINTQEIEESEKLNNIKYKLEHNQKITTFEVYDLIWMPKFRSDRKPEDIVVELTEIYTQIVINEEFQHLLRTSLILWVGKYVSDKEKRAIAEVNLGMTAQEIVELREGDIINARIDGMLCRAEETGELNGMRKGKREGIRQGERKGERKIVLALLESMGIEEVSQVTKLSIEKIEDLRNFE